MSAFETLATVKLVRDQDGHYTAVIELGEGDAPQAIQGYSTIGSVMDGAARIVADALSFPRARRGSGP